MNESKPHMPKIKIFIISWRGVHERAATIATALAKYSDDISIVMSGDDDDIFGTSSVNIIRRDDSLFWADKFVGALEHCPDDSVMLIIHADCRSENWPEVVQRCSYAFAHIANLGVWSPKTRGTPYRLEKTRLSRIRGTSYSIVAQTDVLVLAIGPKVLHRMRAADYSGNIYGWGIDWLIVCAAHARGYPVVVDEAVTVHHRISNNYSTGDARAQMHAFFEQFTPAEREQQRQLWDYMQSRKRWANLLYKLETARSDFRRWLARKRR